MQYFTVIFNYFSWSISLC